MGRSCCRGQTQLPVCSRGLLEDVNAVPAKAGLLCLLPVQSCWGGGQTCVTYTLPAGRLQRLFGGLGLGHWQNLGHF